MMCILHEQDEYLNMSLPKKTNAWSLKISSFWRVSDNPKNPKI